MSRRIVAALLSGLMTISSITPSLSQFRAAVDRVETPSFWIGKPAIELFESWGSPDRSVLIEGGGSYLIYKQGRKVGLFDDRPYDSLSRKRGLVLRGDLQFKTDQFNRIEEFRYLNDEPGVSKAAWFWGGFAVGIVATMAALVIAISVAFSGSGSMY